MKTEKTEKTENPFDSLNERLQQKAAELAAGIIRHEVEKLIQNLDSFVRSTVHTHANGVPVSALLPGSEEVVTADACPLPPKEKKAKAKAKAKAGKSRRYRLHSEETRNAVVAAVRQGKHVAAVSREFDLHSTLVNNWCARAGVTPKKASGTPCG